MESTKKSDNNTTWNRRRVVRPSRQRRLGRNNWRSLAERRQLRGLTTRGTTPKRRLEQRILLAEIDAVARALSNVFHDLPAPARAKCLELANHLSGMRKKVV